MIDDPQASRVLDRLYAESKGDWKQFVARVPGVLGGWMTGRTTMESITPAQLARAYLPVSRAGGELLYVAARAANAQRIVEFGCSFGISTIFLALAARDTGGHVTTTEIAPNKVAATRANVAEAGLAAHVTVLEGDALDTLRGVEGPVDLLFLDGWKNLYLPVLELLRPKLRKGSLVVADNVDLADARPFVDRVRADRGAFAPCHVLDRHTLLACVTAEPPAPAG